MGWRVKYLWRVLARFGAFLAVLGGPGSAWAAPGGQAETREPRPAIWLLEDADTKIYLFGTIHILPPGLRWRSAALERIIAKAGELVVEDYSPPDSGEAEEAAALFMRAEPSPILERVPAERRELLRAAIEAGPIPLEAYDMMHSWAAAVMLGLSDLFGDYGVGAGELAADGAEASEVTGVEVELERAFRDARKPIRSVENSLTVLRALGALPAPLQDQLLAEAIGDASEASDAFDAGLASWLYGKAERMTIAPDAFPEEMHDILLRRRNVAWTGWLIERLERPGVILFAVGAGHLAGPDSVQRLLEHRGHRVRRVH